MYYRPAVEALSKIGTRKALKWIADEFLYNIKREKDSFKCLILYFALAGNDNSKRYVGFEIISREYKKDDTKQISKINFNVLKNNFKFIMEVG